MHAFIVHIKLMEKFVLTKSRADYFVNEFKLERYFSAGGQTAYFKLDKNGTPFVLGVMQDNTWSVNRIATHEKIRGVQNVV